MKQELKELKELTSKFVKARDEFEAKKEVFELTAMFVPVNYAYLGLDEDTEIVKYMLEEYEDDPTKIWQSNMFGKSLYELVCDGFRTKLDHITSDSRSRLSDTLTRVVNEGSNGLICIIL